DLLHRNREQTPFEQVRIDGEETIVELRIPVESALPELAPRLLLVYRGGQQEELERPLDRGELTICGPDRVRDGARSEGKIVLHLAGGLHPQKFVQGLPEDL